MLLPERFAETLDKIRKIVATLTAGDVRIGPLHDALDELERHAHNIQEIEDHAEAIRAEIIRPVQTRLDMQARHSRWGARLGFAGFVVTIFGITWATAKDLREAPHAAVPDASVGEVMAKLEAIETHLLFPGSLEVAEGEVFVQSFRADTLAALGDGTAVVLGIE